MNRKPNFHRGHGLIVAVLVTFAVIALAAVFVPTPAKADQTGSVPELRVPSVIICRSSTDVASAISATNTWDIAANGSGYTVAWEMDTALTDEIGVYISASNVNSGTHTLYLQASNDGTNFANITEAVSTNVTSATTAAPYVRQAAVTKNTIAAAGDYAFRFTGFGRFKYLRLHLDADASHACNIDLAQVCKF